MGSPTVFTGSRTKFISSKGALLKDGSVIDNDGVPNFIKNGHAEIDTTGWATYADAAQSTPVDGTGGTANVTWARTTTTPLAGAGSFTFTKDTANRQGQGVSYTFTVDPSYRARVCNIQFDYIFTNINGSFDTSNPNLTVYIYDVTNATVIQPSSFKFMSNSQTISDTFQSSFQTSATGSQYRLIFHVATVSTSGYTIKFDNIQVTPTEYAFGTPITDPQDWTPTVTGLGTVTINRARWWREGAYMCGEVRITAGTVSASAVTFTIPSGYSVDYSSSQVLGFGNSTNTTYPDVNLIWDSSGATNLISIINTMAGSSGFTVLSGTSLGTGSVTTLQFKAKILGWSSSVQTSDQTSTRVIAAKYNGATATLTSSLSKVTFTTKVIDDTNSYSSGTYTVPVAGKYKVSASLLIARVSTVSSNNLQIATYKGGIFQSGNIFRDQSTEPQSRSVLITDILDCKAGDTIEIYAAAEGTTPSIVSDTNRNFLVIERLAGPNQIAASETVAARYTDTSGQSLANGPTTIAFATKDYDTHGMVSSSVATIPISGTYEIRGLFRGAVNNVATATMRLYAYKNSATSYLLGELFPAASGNQNYTVEGSIRLKLNAGDTIALRLQTTFASNIIGSSTANDNSFEILRVGN